MSALLDILDLSPAELTALMDTADDIAAHPDDYRARCRGKKLATLFFEPSTRTRLSFEAAMYELGGNVLGFSEPGNSSVSKGETVADTARTVGNYADIIAMRHPLEGAPAVAALYAGVPVINAGDGGHNHPTQTLADLLTIRREHGRLGGLTVGLCGDLKYGRTVHSLARALARYPGNTFVFIAPAELGMPDYVKSDLRAAGVAFRETASLEEALPALDVLYMTRVQRERFADPAQYERLKDSYVLTPEKMALGGANLRVLHPLPRVTEIDPAVDADPRACYFEQVLCGKQMRMALILRLLGQKDAPLRAPAPGTGRCPNPRCISNHERALPARFTEKDGRRRCYYCENEI